MRRTGTALLLAFLLTACRGDPYVPVEVAMTDPNVLNGTWQGELTQSHWVNWLATTKDSLYLIDGNKLERRDLQTGQVLKRITLPESGHVTWRQDNVLLVVTPRELLMFDAMTLTALPGWTFPNSSEHASYRWNLSNDGSTVTDQGTTPYAVYSTSTGEKIGSYSLSSNEALFSMSSNGQWILTSKDKLQTFQVRNVVTGTSFTLPAHTGKQGCPLLPYSQPNLEAISFTGGHQELVLAYGDGTIDRVDMTGKVVKQEDLGACKQLSLISLPGQPGQFRYDLTPRPDAAQTDAPGETGVYDLFTGNKLHAYQLQQGETTVAAPDGLVIRQGNSYRFQNWQGQGWDFETATYTLTLNVTTTRVSDREGKVTGTAVLNGRSLTVEGKLNAADAVLKPQMRAFLPTLEGAFQLKDGNDVAGQLILWNSLPYVAGKPPTVNPATTPGYAAMWSDEQVSLAQGMLTKP